MQEVDVVGQEILAKVLELTGYSRGIFQGGQSRGTASAKRKIYAMMRYCNHPEIGQLSIKRIGEVCGVDYTVVRHHLNKHGPMEVWDFHATKVAPAESPKPITSVDGAD